MPSATNLPKCCRWENERKFLVSPTDLGFLAGLAPTRIEDRYLTCGRLRVRTIRDVDGAQTYRLAKKFPSDDPYTQPIVCVYLCGSAATRPGNPWSEEVSCPTP